MCLQRAYEAGDVFCCVPPKRALTLKRALSARASSIRQQERVDNYTSLCNAQRVHKRARRVTAELFPLGRPMPPTQMVGRARTVAELAEGLVDGTNAALPGLRLTGKTTACEAALCAASCVGVIPVSVDMYAIRTEHEFVNALYDAILAAVAPPARAVGALGGLPARLARAGLRRLDLPPEVEALVRRVPAEGGRAEAVLRLPNDVARVRRKRLGLLIDEAQRLHAFTDQFRRTLHQALRESDQVSVLLTGSDASLMNGFLAEPFAPVAGLIMHRPMLDEISDEEWYVGLRSLFALDGCHVEDGALRLIVGAAKSVGVSAVHSTIAISHHVHSLSKIQETQKIDEDLALQGYERVEPELRRLEETA
jgi:hypothetical protein